MIHPTKVRPGQFNIVSFHNPAPPQRGQVAMSGKARQQAGLVLTSLDEDRRQQAVSVVKRCLDVASEYGAQAFARVSCPNVHWDAWIA